MGKGGGSRQHRRVAQQGGALQREHCARANNGAQCNAHKPERKVAEGRALQPVHKRRDELRFSHLDAHSRIEREVEEYLHRGDTNADGRRERRRRWAVDRA